VEVLRRKEGGKGKENEVTAIVEEKDDDEDGMWMAMADVEKEAQERVEYEVGLWMADEISTECDVWAEDIY
jgi:hypothetical protein